MTLELQPTIDLIVAARRVTPAERAALVAISRRERQGLPNCTDRCDLGPTALARRQHQHRRLVESAAVRFNDTNPAEHFYLHAIRFDEMFADLIFPLRDHRSIRLEMDYAEETATSYRKQLCEFTDIDILLLEGIYLLKRSIQQYYDLSFWIDCSFETALERAIARAQESLPPEATINAYRTIYFPAQEIHFARDNPKAAATATINNDPRLSR